MCDVRSGVLCGLLRVASIKRRIEGGEADKQAHLRKSANQPYSSMLPRRKMLFISCIKVDAHSTPVAMD